MCRDLRRHRIYTVPSYMDIYRVINPLQLARSKTTQLNPTKDPKIFVNRLGSRCLSDTLATNEITDYCVPNHTLGSPVWVPNRHQVVFETGISEHEVFFADLDDNFYTKIAEGVSPIGWMVESP